MEIIVEYTDSNTSVIKTSLLSIYKNLFQHSNEIRKITVPEGINLIESSCFANDFPALEEVILPKSCTVINARAFAECQSLKKINLENVKKISDYAFAYTSLENVNLSSLDVINPKSFAYCQELKNIIFSKDLNIIEQFAFDGCISLKKIDLSETKLLRIGMSAFRHTNLNNILLPESGVVIYSNAFNNLNIKNITIPRNAKLKLDCFYDCNFEHFFLKQEYINFSYYKTNKINFLHLPDIIDFDNSNSIEIKNIVYNNFVFKIPSHKKIFFEYYNTKDLSVLTPDITKYSPPLEDLLNEGKSFKQINKIFKEKSDIEI